ncbi:hypothetical protein AWB91_09600 [Mycobacterium paraense]|uniref:Amidohydrolase-related domain-containing protein n=1 Tax=Mycobacterium paraense TaxID=767916 RepID=A0ABX3VRA3_9MYCO|nr:hypothetical protein AWB91_09600 [Mycobacterium paraense]ORW44960.1 hypothetical protein AWB88_04670 [Mycobacterium paraense]
MAPLLNEQLRDYCPKKYLDDFDEFVKFNDSLPQRMGGPERTDNPRLSHYRNALTTGGWDVHQRLRDMDRDGVAGEIVFHGLNAGRQDLMPFNGAFGAFGIRGFDQELVAAGRHMYNRWLADFCSVEPDRHAGLAHVPIWDPEAAADEIEWAAEAGLKGINFPRPQPANPAYNDPAWDRFYAAAAANNMPLTTHAQAAGAPPVSQKPKPGDFEVYTLEIMGEGGRTALPLLLFGGVFDRHPNLKLVYTEVVDDWWPTTMARLDDFYLNFSSKLESLPEVLRVDTGPYPPTKLSALPSELCKQHVFIGWSCIAPFEAARAVEGGFDSQILWGSDYPHPEGSWQYPRSDDEVPITHLHLRDSFAAVPADKAAGMIGVNAANVYGMDVAKLQEVANRINSLTFQQLSVPYEDPVEDVLTRSARFCFRRSGPFG